MADHNFEGSLAVTGSVGIGTEPLSNAQLYIRSSSDRAQTLVENSDGSLLKLAIDNNEITVGSDTGTNLPLNLQTNGRSRLSISASGNVGIGSSNPSERLEVDGIVKAAAFRGDGSALTNIKNVGNGVIDTSQIADKAVKTIKLDNDSVDTSKLANGAVTTLKITDSAVNTAKLADNSVSTGKLANGAVTAQKIANSAVNTANLVDNSVSTGKLANGAVTTLKITDSAVNASKLADNSVSTGKLANGAVTAQKIANSAVNTANLVDNSVSTSKLANGAVTVDKLALSVRPFTVNGVSNPGGDIRLVGGNSITIAAENSTKQISIRENHSALTNNPHRVTAAQVGALPLTGGTLTSKLNIGGTDGQNALYIASDFDLRGNDRLRLIRFGNSGDYQILHKASGALGRNTLAMHVHQSDAFGVYSSGWRSLFEVEGGTGNVYARGNVGIGTEAPNRALTIHSNRPAYLNVRANNGENEVLLGADGSGGIISTMTDHDLQLRAGQNRTRMIIKANGNVGINASNPSERLDVSGTVKATRFQGDGSNLTNIPIKSLKTSLVFDGQVSFSRDRRTTSITIEHNIGGEHRFYLVSVSGRQSGYPFHINWRHEYFPPIAGQIIRFERPGAPHTMPAMSLNCKAYRVHES